AALLVALLTLLLLACGSSPQARAPKPKATANMGAMPGLPAWADRLKVRIVSPADQTTLTQNTLELKLAFGGYQPNCLLAGTPVTKGTGHFHVLLDGVLVDMFCSSTVELSMQNVPPGHHTVTVVPALNDHATVDMNSVSLHFNYQPSSPLPWIGPAQLGKPVLHITGPANGQKVQGTFTMSVAVNDYQLSCALRGKAKVPGYGSWIVNLDTLNGPMGGMATMADISCDSTITLSTEGMTPGQHAFIAYLADDQQQPIVPLVSDQIVIDVG
ncbi:MAG: hypothetical protein WAM30_10570, partial [Candidatus Dormiibacterota bacterium]